MKKVEMWEKVRYKSRKHEYKKAQKAETVCWSWETVAKSANLNFLL